MKITVDRGDERILHVMITHIELDAWLDSIVFCHILKYLAYRMIPIARIAMQDTDTVARSNNTVGLVMAAPLRKSEVSASVM